MGQNTTRVSRGSQPDLAIEGDPCLHTQADNFGVRVKEGSLVVPDKVAEILKRYDIRTAAEFVALLHSFPSGLAKELGWSAQEMGRATTCLLRELADVLPERA